MKPKLVVVIASTRPGRIGASVGKWFMDFAERNGGFHVRVADLAEIDLPILDEPAHPRLQQYEHDHTRRWSAIVNEADAFVIVTPEYNFSSPPALVNALHYLYNEWNYKPVAFVSYGGASGGMRSVQMTKMITTTLKMVPLVEAVTIPMVWDRLSDQGEFTADEREEKPAAAMLKELTRWADALRPLREERS
jgi:NAD(P)H-dependent FMN reductase